MTKTYWGVAIGRASIPRIAREGSGPLLANRGAGLNVFRVTPSPGLTRRSRAPRSEHVAPRCPAQGRGMTREKIHSKQLRQALLEPQGERVERILLKRPDLAERRGEFRRREFCDRQNAAPIVADEEVAILALVVGEAVRARRHADYREPRRHGFRDHGARILGADDDLSLAENLGQGARPGF